MREVKELVRKIKPDKTILVVDATIGQLAAKQARAFHEVAPLGAIFVTKLDGAAKGGGALSAAAATGAVVEFIGTGEKLEDVEVFDPARFVGRLLGMGDLPALLKRLEEAYKGVPKAKVESVLRGAFTLEDLCEELERLAKAGGISSLLSLLPGMPKIPKEELRRIEEKARKWRVIIQSMTKEERANPKIINASRVRRIARGAGVDERDVRELLKQYFAARKLLKSMDKRKLRMWLGRRLARQA